MFPTVVTTMFPTTDAPSTAITFTPPTRLYFRFRPVAPEVKPIRYTEILNGVPASVCV